ncbi:hypothetical protein ACHAWU_008654 [Discostella pseudostelligera]|uniref:Uncharacterized protein n=1 Tax=Discostella pseudostelligera TaxID=259834 RepID=A0ABD3MEQ1_9STRA
MKLDFLGSLENAYDFNDANPASTLFLSRLVEQVSPEAISRNIIESFGDLGAGKWRVVYVQECSTSFGFGSLFGSVTSAVVELGIDGSIACHLQCRNPMPYELSVIGNFGTGNDVCVFIPLCNTKLSHR